MAMVSLSGNIATELKQSYLQKNGQPMTDQHTGQPILVVEFSIAVSRQGRQKTGLDGKVYDSDLVRVRAIGAKAVSLVQYGCKGRSLSVTGNLLQDEWIGTQTVSMDKSHPLYATLAQFVQMQNPNVQADQFGNLYFVAKAPSKAVTLELTSYDWLGANPNNANMYSPANYVPNVGNAMIGATPNMPSLSNTAFTPGLPSLPQNQQVAQPVMTPQYPQEQYSSAPFGNDAVGTMPVLPNSPNVAPNANYQIVQGQTNPTPNSVPNMTNAQIPQDFTNIPQPVVQQPVVQQPTAQQSVQTPQPVVQQPVVQQPAQANATSQQEPALPSEKADNTTAFTPNGENQGF